MGNRQSLKETEPLLEHKASYSTDCDLCTHGDTTKDIIFQYDSYPFTNLVFEGGGGKGLSHIGALKILEDAGITDNIVRVAGASAGALVATLFAIGFRSKELEELMDPNMNKILLDHQCGLCSFLPNLLGGFGWNPGKKLLKWIEELLNEQTGKADITFKEIYAQYGCELCIVVTNLSLMTTEYFHPKTTPDCPVKIAVRMSMAIPVLFKSVRHSMDHINTDHFVDGGMLCNYPIHAFDGWWLSMEKKDSFFHKLQEMDEYAVLFAKSNRFGTWNPQTIGISLFSDYEEGPMKRELTARLGAGPPAPENSKLYRSRMELMRQSGLAKEEHWKLVNALSRFMKEVQRSDFDLHGSISRSEFRELMETSSTFTVADRLLVFGHAEANESFSELDVNGDGVVTFQELIIYIEKKGVDMQNRFLGHKRQEIKSFPEFLNSVQTAMRVNLKRGYIEERDVERTIGINTGYIGTLDLDLEECDRNFLMENGAAAARSFLHHYCKRNTIMGTKGARRRSRRGVNFIEEETCGSE